MSPGPDSLPESSRSPSPDLPDDLEERLSRLDDAELRAVVSYVTSLLPAPPTVAERLEERPGEEILEVEERDGYTNVVKRQPCAQGCEECPHGPYLYHVRAERYPDDRDSESLHWEFLGPVR